MFGWAALWTLQRNNLTTIGFPDLILFLFAFAGITGHLPFTFMTLIETSKQITSKALGWVDKNIETK